MTTTLRASRRISATSTLSATPSRARVQAPRVFRGSLLAASSVVAIGLVTAFGGTGAYAIDGTWNGTTSNQWNTGTNWSSTPNTPDGVATFTTNNPTAITISGAVALTAIGTIQFNAGASAYTFTVNNQFNIASGTVIAQGIINNSGVTQTFMNNSTMVFTGVTSAGTNVNITNNGNLIFTGDSTGGNATFTSNAGKLIDFSQSVASLWGA
jgi:hypothetical protein